MEKIISLDSIISNKKPFYFMYNGQRYNAAFYGNHTMFKYEEIEPAPDYTTPFYIEPVNSSGYSVSIIQVDLAAPTITIEYSTDKVNWSTWCTTSIYSQILHIPVRTYFRCNTTSWAGRDWNSIDTNQFGATGEVKIGGNIMSLLYGSNFTGEETTIRGDYAFYNIFNFTYGYDATDLLLPATTLRRSCYAYLFVGCKMAKAPELPALDLVEGCYSFMFQSCPNLQYVKAMFTTDITYNNSYTNNWLSYGVPSTGTFVKNANATWNRTDASGTNGWTIITEQP